MVEHGRDLTFSLMIPEGEAAASMPPALFYRELHRRIAGWLSSFLSSEVRLAGEGDIQSGPLCFTAPAGDDLLLLGQKILGGAQRRSAGALLYQGSIQNLQGLAGVSLESLDYLAMASSLSCKVGESILTKVVLDEANLLADKKYRSREWSERR
jgi:lipoate-protein ligase A